MDSTLSLSKACFAFKKKRKSSSVSPKKSSLKRFKNSLDEERNRRLATYASLEALIDQRVEALNGKVNSRIFSDLKNFVLKSIHECTGNSQAFVNGVPTAALMMGVNLPDHGATFLQLKSILRQVSPCIASLTVEVGASVKSMVQSLVSQVIGAEMDNVGGKESPLRKSNSTMPVLASWYQSKFNQLGQEIETSPKSNHLKKGGISASLKSPCKIQITRDIKSPKSKNTLVPELQRHGPGIVIILEDIEHFVPNIIQDFILICREYFQSIPFVLVMGLSTSMAALHHLLPHTVSSQLVIEKFCVYPPNQYLDKMLAKVMFNSKNPFKLGSKVIKLLGDVFLCHDFSVRNFIQSYKFCLMEYFYTSPVSILCCQDEELDEVIEALKSTQLDEVRQLDSFRSLVESKSKAEQRALLLNDDYTKIEIKNQLHNISQFHRIFFPLLYGLNILTNKLPKYPLGKQVRELYTLCVDCNVMDTEEFNEAMKLLRMMDKEELVIQVQYALHAIWKWHPLPYDLEAVLKNISEILSLLKCGDHISDGDNLSGDEVMNKTDRFKFKERLKKMAVEKRLSPFEKQRDKLLAALDDLFRTFLKAPQSLPLNEIFYFNDVKAIKRQLIGNQRGAVQTALSNPWYYLKCECCHLEDHGSILSSLPDISIAYKLHQECGRYINLFDWLQAFVTIVNPTARHNGKGPDISENLQARFAHALSELQFLGFIQPTKRKTDHVVRLTWGDC